MITTYKDHMTNKVFEATETYEIRKSLALTLLDCGMAKKVTGKDAAQPIEKKQGDHTCH